MKQVHRFGRHSWKGIALAAAMVLNLAAASAESAFPVSAESTSEDGATSIGTVREPKLKNVEMYRWEKITPGNITQKGGFDYEEHPALFINRDGYLLAGVVEDDVIRGKSSLEIKNSNTKRTTITSDSAFWSSSEMDVMKNNVDEEKSHFITHNGIRAGYTDKQLAPDESVFYTSDDRNCVFAKYTGSNTEVSRDNSIWYGLMTNGMALFLTLMGGHPPMFSIRMRSSSSERPYYLVPGESSNESILTVTNQTTGEFTFSVSDECWLPYKYDGFSLWADSEYLVQRGDYWFCADGDIHDGAGGKDWLSMYWGERWVFAGIDGAVGVEDYTLSIKEGDIVQADGTVEHTRGTMLCEGTTLTIGKGGVLAISGDFINNGRIINNGGTILIKDGGSLYPFQPGDDVKKNGNGSIVCTDGDIVIQEGGALYAGLPNSSGAVADFQMLGSSQIIDQGVLAYGVLELSENAALEIYETGKAYGGLQNWTNKNHSIKREYELLSEYNEEIVEKNGVFGKFTRFDVAKYGGSAQESVPVEQFRMGVVRVGGTGNYPLNVRAVKGYEGNFVDPFKDVRKITVGTFEL